MEGLISFPESHDLFLYGVSAMARKKISLNQLVEQLFNVPVPSLSAQQNQGEIKPTTIRPDAKTAHFFSYHADRLNISMQDMMALALNAVVSATQTPVRTEFQLAVDRFKHIFEAHRLVGEPAARSRAIRFMVPGLRGLLAFGQCLCAG